MVSNVNSHHPPLQSGGRRVEFFDPHLGKWVEIACVGPSGDASSNSARWERALAMAERVADEDRLDEAHGRVIFFA